MKHIAIGVFHIIYPKKDVEQSVFSAIYGSLKHLVGKTVPKAMLKKNLLRVIANWHFVMEGMAVPEWDGTITSSDVVFIGVARLKESRDGRQRLLVSLKLKTGLGAGIIQCTVFTTAQALDFLDRKSGCSSFNCAAEEIAGMEARLLVSVKPDGLLKVDAWGDCTEAQRRHNKKLSQLRGDPQKCQLAPSPCNVCRKTIHECNLAVWLGDKEKTNG